MINKELTELVAKAVGYDQVSQWDDTYKCMTDHEGFTFDPLNDDADVFKLSVQFGVGIEHNHPQDNDLWVVASDQKLANQCLVEIQDESGRLDATRLAIVKCVINIWDKL